LCYTRYKTTEKTLPSKRPKPRLTWTNLQNIKESKTKFPNFPKSQPSSLSWKSKRGKVNPHIKEKKTMDFKNIILSIATTFLFSSPAWKLLRKKKEKTRPKEN